MSAHRMTFPTVPGSTPRQQFENLVRQVISAPKAKRDRDLTAAISNARGDRTMAKVPKVKTWRQTKVRGKPYKKGSIRAAPGPAKK